MGFKLCAACLQNKDIFFFCKRAGIEDMRGNEAKGTVTTLYWVPSMSQELRGLYDVYFYISFP